MNVRRRTPRRLTLTTDPTRPNRGGRRLPTWYWRNRFERIADTGRLEVLFRGDNRSKCPYFLGKPGGTCNRGCWDEPSCHVDLGWGPASDRWPIFPVDVHRIARRVGATA